MSNYTEDQLAKDLEGQEYKFGFTSNFESDKAPKGLNEDIIRFISFSSMSCATHPSRIRKNSSSGVLERLNSVDALVVVHPFFNAQSRISKLPSSVAF